jgi:nucleotide-binding universal stress UspA family protein
MYRKILVPLDGSEADAVVLDHVKRLAKQFGAAVGLIMIYRLAKSEDPFERQIQLEDGSSGYRARLKAQAYLPEVEQSVRGEGIEVATEFLLVEEPEARAIVAYAERNDFDLIALANRERSPIGNFFFGSIEEKVRRRSALPVLFVAKPRS